MNRKRKIVLISFIILLLTLTAQPVLSQTAENDSSNPGGLFSEAVNYYFQAEYKNAAEIFSEILELNNLDDQLRTDTLYYSALTAVKNYDTSTALSNLR